MKLNWNENNHLQITRYQSWIYKSKISKIKGEVWKEINTFGRNGSGLSPKTTDQNMQIRIIKASKIDSYWFI